MLNPLKIVSNSLNLEIKGIRQNITDCKKNK